MGMAGVGKSCLIKRYCEEKFVQKYISTIGVDYGVKVCTCAAFFRHLTHVSALYTLLGYGRMDSLMFLF